jgi:chromosome segregation ATPase
MTVEFVLQSLMIAGLALLWLVLKNSLPSYLSEKGKNLASKEDIEEITNKVESVKAEIATALEASKLSLNKELHEFSTRFSRVDSQRASGILEIHGTMCDIEQLLIWDSGSAATAMVSPTPEVRSMEALNKAWEGIAKLNRALNYHSLLMDEQTYERVQAWSRSVMAALAAIGNEIEPLRKQAASRGGSIQEREAVIASIRDNHLDAYIPELGNVRRQIAMQFRHLLSSQTV